MTELSQDLNVAGTHVLADNFGSTLGGSQSCQSPGWYLAPTTVSKNPQPTLPTQLTYP